MTAAPSRESLHCIYVAASALDARYTRICVASIRHFYPSVTIKLLVGGALERGLARELRRYWGVQVSDVRPAEWGWGFVKLEPLFGRPGQRFMVLDSDTVLAGPVLDAWAACKGDFLVDDESQDEANVLRLYYDWKLARAFDAHARPPSFVFNSGQWFGTAGVLSREDFAPVLDWSRMPPRVRYPDCFRNGEQGVLNYVLNQKAMLAGLSVDRAKIMRWPGHDMKDLTARSIAERRAPPVVIHWAGLKLPRLGAMAGADVLDYFERAYYSRLPQGPARRFLAGIRHPLADWMHGIKTRVAQRVSRISRGKRQA